MSNYHYSLLAFLNWAAALRDSKKFEDHWIVELEHAECLSIIKLTTYHKSNSSYCIYRILPLYVYTHAHTIFSKYVPENMG